MDPKYLRKVDTNECFAFSIHLEKRNDMVPWFGPLPWEKEGALPVVEKRAAIAIHVIQPEEPKVEEEKKPEYVCGLCGFVAKNSSGLRMHSKKH